MDQTTSLLWAGTEEAFQVFLTAQLGMQAALLAGRMPGEAQSRSLPRLLSIHDNLAVVSVNGPLTASDSWLNEMFGLTSYNEIRDAVGAAAADPKVGTIILDINSGGGTVAGVSDTGAFIRQVNDNVKPVVSFTDGNMLSAAYWLGSSAGNIFSSPTGMVGSIGVLMMHVERSKALEKDGITATVLRAGEFKARLNPVEPLTDASRAQAQAILDEQYKVFVSQVAEARDVPYAVADQKMAQGREFVGEQALQAGLVDGVLSFDQLVRHIQSVDKR